jgi:hypothetical protein
MSVILALRKLTQEGHEFKARLSYLARSCLKKLNKWLGMVAHAWNPSYMGGDQEDLWFKASSGDKS